MVRAMRSICRIPVRQSVPARHGMPSRYSALARYLATGLLVAAAAAQGAEAPDGPVAQEKIVLDETVISGNQELPKVLYIVPWQQPGGVPEIELRTDFAEEALFRRLYPPAYRREISYFENLQQNHPKE